MTLRAGAGVDGLRPINIFISYSQRDAKDLAQTLYRDLKASGYDVWLDQKRIHGGAIWTKEIEDALDAADVVLALLTTESCA